VQLLQIEFAEKAFDSGYEFVGVDSWVNRRRTSSDEVGGDELRTDERSPRHSQAIYQGKWIG
jgi:hypothetical protein